MGIGGNNGNASIPDSHTLLSDLNEYLTPT
jgi:hypothetical protein